jgi:hypothetical protein
MKNVHFKMENIPTLVDLWQENDFAISFNLKDTYNHISVHFSSSYKMKK